MRLSKHGIIFLSGGFLFGLGVFLATITQLRLFGLFSVIGVLCCGYYLTYGLQLEDKE